MGLWYVVTAGTTGRPIWLHSTTYKVCPHIDLVNAGATDIYIKASTLSSGSSESSGFVIHSSNTLNTRLDPWDDLHVYTTNATCLVGVHVYGEYASTEPNHTAS